MIKALKIISWIASSFVLLTLILLCVAFSYQGNDHGAIAAIRSVVCQKLLHKADHSISEYELGQAIGKYIVFPAITYTILLLALYKRKRALYIASLVLLIFIALGELGNGGLPFFKVIMIVLLFTNPVRKYFKKPDPNEKIADSF